MFLKSDQVLANRTIPDSVKAGNHDKLSMSWLPISPKWSTLRKISSIKILSTQRLDASQAKVNQVLAYVQDCCTKMQPVDIGRPVMSLVDPKIVFQDIIHERQKIRLVNHSVAKQANNVLDTLPNLYEENELTMDEIDHLLVDIFDAGTDTTASILESALTELVKNPELIVKAQNEIEKTLGKDFPSIQESDIS
uniref:Cytochrome P450 n=1 Tax=Chenopodium quinoa TaxID=63459 RepID=A0A803LTH6_CHEQI